MKIVTMVVALSVACVPATAGATAQRTFVSTAGVDTNTASNCSLVAPCRSFGAAMSVTNDGGEIIVLDSGGYGAVMIDRSVTIESPAGVYAGMTVASGDGAVVNAPAGRVTLRGLSINGLGGNRGIVLTAADTLRVERCSITNMGGAAIKSTSTTSRLHVYDTLISNFGASGIDVDGGDELVIERTRAERGYSTNVQAFNVTSVVVRDSVFIGSTFGGGLELISNNAGLVSAIIDRVVIADNGNEAVNVFGNVLSAVSAAITNSHMSRNGTQVSSNGTLRANSSSGSTQLTVEHTTIQRNYGPGIVAIGSGTRVTVSNSTIVGNTDVALAQGTSATLYTRSNNTIRGNNGSELGSQTSGTITPLGGS